MQDVKINLEQLARLRAFIGGLKATLDGCQQVLVNGYHGSDSHETGILETRIASLMSVMNELYLAGDLHYPDVVYAMVEQPPPAPAAIRKVKLSLVVSNP